MHSHSFSSNTVAVPPTGHSHQRVTWAPEANNFMIGLTALDLESSTYNTLGMQFITGMAKYWPRYCGCNVSTCYWLLIWVTRCAISALCIPFYGVIEFKLLTEFWPYNCETVWFFWIIIKARIIDVGHDWPITPDLTDRWLSFVQYSPTYPQCLQKFTTHIF